MTHFGEQQMKSGFEKVIEEALKAVSYKDSNDNERLKAAILDLSGKNSDESDFIASVASDEFLKICSAAIQCESDQIGAIKEKASSCLQNSKFRTDKDYSDKMANCVVNGFLLYAGKYVNEIDIDDKLSEIATGEIISADDDKTCENSKKEEVREEKTNVKVGGNEQKPIIKKRDQKDEDKSSGSDTEDNPESSSGDDPDNSNKPKKKRRIIIGTAVAALLLCGVIGGILYSKHQDYLDRTYQSTDSQAPTISDEEVNIGKGGQFQLFVDNVHEGDGVVWDSSNPDCVEVDENGNLSADELGNATITAYVDNYEDPLICEVYVNELSLGIPSDVGYYDFTDITEGETVTLFVDGTDTEDIEWSTSDSSILSLDSDSGATVNLTAEKCGFATIKAEVDGQTVSVNPEIWLKKNNILRVSEDDVTVSKDKKKIYITSSVEASHIWYTTDNKDIAEVEFTEEWHGACEYIYIVKRGTGTTKISFWAGDENGNRDYDVESKTISVKCE